MYNGDAVFAASSADLPSQTVNAAPLVATSTVLATTPNPSGFGHQVVLTATVTAADASAVGGTVTFLEGTTVLGSGSVGSGGKAMLEVSSLPVGSDVITAHYTGDAGHKASVSNTVTQVVQPASVVAPTVASLERFGFHMQPTTLVLTFSTALDAVSAQSVHNYRITTLGGRGRGGSLVGHSTRIRKAIYDPSTYTVTLVPMDRLDIHNRYQLTVNGSTQTGVRGANGLLLDGAAHGSADSDYVAVVSMNTLAGPAPGWSKTPTATGVHQVRHSGGPSAAGFDLLASSGVLATVSGKQRRHAPLR